jgi:hypothetical protein
MKMNRQIKPEMSTQEWQQASTVLALIREGVNDVDRLAKYLGNGQGKTAQLLSRLNLLQLIMWLDGRPFLTRLGLHSCRLIQFARRRDDGVLTKHLCKPFVIAHVPRKVKNEHRKKSIV